MAFSTELFLEYKKRPGKPALARLLERHQDAVYSICHHVLRHPQDAEDACQEVLLEVSRQVDSIEEPDRFAGWLYRTALHTALDVKRKRGRQRIRDAGIRPPSEAGAPAEATEALHQELARLDDLSRQLVVEHYFASRPLRELAEERGCSEVAVWKRIESARERLRKVLGSAALSALDGVGTLRAPAGLAKQALLRGGLTMAASGGIKLAIVAPLVLLAGAGIVMNARHDSARAETTRTPLAESPKASGAAAGKLAASADARRRDPAKGAAPRRPYPYRLAPVPPEKQAAAHTWEILSTHKVSFDESGTRAEAILRDLARQTGLTFVTDVGALDGEIFSINLKDITIDGCLHLILNPREQGYEIRLDGSVRIGRTQDLAGGYEQEARNFRNIPKEIDEARSMLDDGWNGVDPGPTKPGRDKRAARTTLPQGESCLKDEIARLESAHEIRVEVDVPTTSEEEEAAWRELMGRRFLQVVEERSLASHLEQLARRNGLVLVVSSSGDRFTLTTEEKAAELRAAQEQEKREQEDLLRKFASPVAVSGEVSVQDLAEAMSRVCGWPVMPSEEVWDGGATLVLPPAATVRESLDALRTQGIRWSMYYDRIYIFK